MCVAADAWPLGGQKTGVISRVIVKKSSTVFGSKSEQRAFAVIAAHVPKGFRLYPNLPLSQIVEVERNEVSAVEWDFYLKSSVDFVLANRRDEPVLAIEFDGLGGGFSSGSTYQPLVASSQKRPTTIEFKLAVCSKSSLPMYVISFDEVHALPGEDSLRIVHGIIAQQLVSKDMQAKIQKWDENDRAIGKTWDEIQWDLARAETSLQHKYDPFRFGLEPIWNEFLKLNASWSLEPVCRPDVLEALRTKRPLESVGCKFAAHGGLVKVPVLLTTWVRNFAGDDFGTVLSADMPVQCGVNPLRVAENVAWYLGVKKTLAVNRFTQ